METSNLPQVYRKDPPYTLNVSYQDFITGTGVVVFYGADMTDSTPTRTYHLFTEAPNMVGCDSEVGVESGFTSDSATLNFDSEVFNKAQVINGYPKVAIPIAIWDQTGAAATESVSITAVKLVHVHSGGGTTDLNTAINLGTCLSDDVPSDTLFNSSVLCVIPKISNYTIPKGDQIRLSITFSASTHAGISFCPSNNPIVVDPADVALQWTNTRLELHVPFLVPS